MKPGERFNPYRRFRNIYIPLGIAADANLSAAAKLTYGALARRAGPNGKCFPKHETLAADLGLTLRSLRRHLNELRLCALIEWERHGDHNEYFFLEHSMLEELPKKDSLGEQELPQVDTQELPSVDTLSPDFHFSFGSANHRVASDAFIDAGWKALKALRRSTPNG